MRTLRLITRFYSGIFLANLLVTLSCVGLLMLFGTKAIEIFGVLFWYKLISMGMIFYLAIYYKKNELYYYQNLGVSKLMLGIATSVIDFILWLIVIVMVIN